MYRLAKDIFVVSRKLKVTIFSIDTSDLFVVDGDFALLVDRLYKGQGNPGDKTPVSEEELIFYLRDHSDTFRTNRFQEASVQSAIRLLLDLKFIENVS